MTAPSANSGTRTNLISHSLIAIFDEDGGGDVDFEEFVSGLSAFSSKGNKEQKLRFAFKVYDIDRDGFISNGELFIVLKMMVGSNLKDQQLQQIVDKTIMEADTDHDGKISFEEFKKMVENTDVSMSMTLGMLWCRGTVIEDHANCCQINFKSSLTIASELVTTITIPNIKRIATWRNSKSQSWSEGSIFLISAANATCGGAPS